ncbi:MAG: hypothetical protein KY467_12075, partial [Gemmatimonadetes bacterium]|nr:hypothetical protein [Gemmatimonadota bacterium]
MSPLAPQRLRVFPLLLSAVLAAACTRPLPAPPDGMLPPPPPTQPPQTVDEQLVTSLNVETGDTVRLTLQVTNASAAPVRFTFPSGQTYDFVVRPAGAGAQLWRWSDGMGFTQA